MSEHPVADLRAARDLAASRAAIRQYRLAARKHSEEAEVLMAKGWFEYAGLSLRLADRLGIAAKGERLP